jgi:hypothetical protein
MWVATKGKKCVSHQNSPSGWKIGFLTRKAKKRNLVWVVAEIQRFPETPPNPSHVPGSKSITIFLRKLRTRKSVISTKKYKNHRFELWIVTVIANPSSEMKRSRNFALDVFPVLCDRPETIKSSEPKVSPARLNQKGRCCLPPDKGSQTCR